MVVHSGFFALCYDPVCFERLEVLDEMKELDRFPLGAVKYSVLRSKLRIREDGLLSNDGESPKLHTDE